MVKSYEPKAYITRKAESRWEWDFLTTKINSTFIKVPFVNINGDWDENIEIIEERKDYAMIKEAKEMQEFAGVSVDNRWIGSRVDTNGFYPEMEKIVKAFKLKNPRANLHIQRPGQMHMMHVDMNYGEGKAYTHLTREEQKQKVIRIFVMLADWQPGQVVTLGNVDYTRWKKGDCAYFSWFDIPHGTANYGHHDRPLLFVSGERTPEFDDILNNDIKQIGI